MQYLVGISLALVVLLCVRVRVFRYTPVAPIPPDAVSVIVTKPTDVAFLWQVRNSAVIASIKRFKYE